MRRIKIGSAKALVGLAISLAVRWCGSTAALAQSFDYSFSVGVTASGVFDAPAASLDLPSSVIAAQ
jgi:hypothetical protein